MARSQIFCVEDLVLSLSPELGYPLKGGSLAASNTEIFKNILPKPISLLYEAYNEFNGVGRNANAFGNHRRTIDNEERLSEAAKFTDLAHKELVKKLLKKYLPAISSTDETILTPSSVNGKNGTTLRQRLRS